MAKIVSFFSGDILKSVSTRSVKIKKNGNKAQVAIILDVLNPAYMGDDSDYEADGDEIVVGDNLELSKVTPQLSFTSEDATHVFFNISWELEVRKVNHGNSFLLSELRGTAKKNKTLKKGTGK